MTPTYVATVRLLLDVAPDVFRGGEFALKGGTALNLFVQDMPRLSVDIDAVFTGTTWTVTTPWRQSWPRWRPSRRAWKGGGWPRRSACLEQPGSQH